MSRFGHAPTPSALTNTRLVLVAFVVVAVAPFAVAATRATFWQRQHSLAPVATALYLAVVLALVVGRYRWAWLVLTALSLLYIVSWVFDGHRFAATSVVGLALDAVGLALLSSATMRDCLRRPVEMPRRFSG